MKSMVQIKCSVNSAVYSILTILLFLVMIGEVFIMKIFIQKEEAIRKMNKITPLPNEYVYQNKYFYFYVILGFFGGFMFGAFNIIDALVIMPG